MRRSKRSSFKKKDIKKAVNDAMKIYYQSGFTMTGFKVHKSIMEKIDKLYEPTNKPKAVR